MEGPDRNRLRTYGRFSPSYLRRAHEGAPERWFLFRKDQMLVVGASDADGAGLPDGSILERHPDARLHHHHLGEIDGEVCCCAMLPDSAEAPEGYRFSPLRPLAALLDADLFRLAGRAFHILHWDGVNRFCGRCGAPTRRKEDERAMVCDACGNVVFPRISPAVIVAVLRDDRILLAHNLHFRPGLYSCVAGYMEPGEEFEDAVEREVFEEVGIRIRNLRYFGSQPWPFPDSLMVGFVAEHDSGEIAVDGVEIGHADWYDRADMPEFPAPSSIAGRMIRWWLESGPGAGVPASADSRPT